MYAGSLSAVTIWGLSISDLAAIVAAVIALVGFILNRRAAMRREKRELELHKLKVQQLQKELKND